METFPLYLKADHQSFCFNCCGRNKGHPATFHPNRTPLITRGKTNHTSIYQLHGRYIYLLIQHVRNELHEHKHSQHFSMIMEKQYLDKFPKWLQKSACKSQFVHFL